MVVDGQYIYTSINILGVGVDVGVSVCTQIHASFHAVGFLMKLTHLSPVQY